MQEAKEAMAEGLSKTFDSLVFFWVSLFQPLQNTSRTLREPDGRSQKEASNFAEYFRARPGRRSQKEASNFAEYFRALPRR